MGHLLRYRRAGTSLKVSFLAVILLISACERPTSRGSAPGKPAAERTPRTRSNAGTQPVPDAPRLPPDESGVVLSITTADHVLDCRTGEYHPVLQSAPAATEAALRCSGDGEGLAFLARGTNDTPALVVATLVAIDGGVELHWSGTERVMECATAKSFREARAVACQGGDIPVIGVSIRKTWR